MMKRCLTLSCAVLLVPVLAGTAAAQTADAVVEKYLAALGGRDALGKLTSRRSTGTATVSNPTGDLSGPLEIDNKLPNKARFLLRLDLTAVGAAGEMVIDQRFDGTAGVLLNSMQGDSDITGNQLDNLRNDRFPTQLLRYKDAAIALEVQPAEKIGGRDAVVLLATPKTGSKVKLYFDAQTSLLVRTVAHVVSDMGDIETTRDLSDYRAVDGVKVPFVIASTNPQQTITIRLSKVEHNVAIDDALFVKK